MKRRSRLSEWLLWSVAAHVLVLALAQLLVCAVDQPYRTDRPLAGVPVPEEKPHYNDYTLRPPIRAISDTGPCLVIPEELWVYGDEDLEQHHGENEATTHSGEERTRPAPDPEYQPGNFSSIDAPIDDIDGWPVSQADAISDIPEGGTGVEGAIGIGGGGSGCFGNPSEEPLLPRESGRYVPESAAVATSDEVLQAALRWLVRNQEPDGRWLVRTHGGSMTDDFSVGVTGSCALALVNKGHTPSTGQHAQTVRRAIEFLIGQQDADGQIGRNTDAPSGGGLNHAMATLALVRTYSFTRSSRIGTAAEQAVVWSYATHQSPSGGWGFSSAAEECDAAVTCWSLMASRAALDAGLPVSGRSFLAAREWLYPPDADEEDNGVDSGSRPPPLAQAVIDHGLRVLGSYERYGKTWRDALSQNRLDRAGVDLQSLYHACAMVEYSYGDFRHFRERVGAYLTWTQRCGSENGAWMIETDPAFQRGGACFSTALGALMIEESIRISSERSQRLVEDDWYFSRALPSWPIDRNHE